MTSFVTPDFPRKHAGLTRISDGLSTVQSFSAKIRSAKGLASGLVAGGVAAVIVVADQIVTAWADGHLLLAWIAMWAIVFALLALFSDTIRTWPTRLGAEIDARLLAYREAAEQAHTCAAAQADHRLIGELQLAKMRADDAARERGEAPPMMAAAPRTSSRFRTAPLPGLPTHTQYFTA